jgi:hypothetical protein
MRQDTNNPILQPTVSAWLHQFADCVRKRDFEAGRALFSSETCSFGTRAEKVNTLDDLVENQWKPIWTSTEGFHFLEDSIDCILSRDESLVSVLALWASLGMDELGRNFPRRGRCTLVLMLSPNSPYGYRAVHSHFSKVPAEYSVAKGL